MTFIASTPLASVREDRRDLGASIAEVCDRIDAVDAYVHALLPEADRRARLLREAAQLESRFSNEADRPPLYGALVAVKDIFRVDGFPTRAGSQLPPELFAGPEADCVTALRAAGALVIGKAMTTEFAYYEPGPTGNPHNVAHTPGGSSSGSAAAVAAGLCHLALGSQTVGSVIRPAAFCGVVGYKPSYGRISTVGVIPFSASVDHVGLFTQDVTGMILAASVLCAEWRGGTLLASRPVLGVPEGPFLDQMPEEGRAAFEAQVERLAVAGYNVQRVRAFADLSTIARRHRQMIAAEMAQVHSGWFAAHESLYRPRTAGIIREGQEVSAASLEESRAARTDLRAALHKQMDAAGIDLWICPPALGTAPVGLAITGDPAMNMPWTNSGLPAVTVPAGKGLNGLPLGLQVVGRYMMDEELLSWTTDIEAVVARIGTLTTNP